MSDTFSKVSGLLAQIKVPTLELSVPEIVLLVISFNIIFIKSRDSVKKEIFFLPRFYMKFWARRYHHLVNGFVFTVLKY